MNFDYRVAVSEDDATYYVQLEVKVPKEVPANLTVSNIQGLGKQFMEGLRS